MSGSKFFRARNAFCLGSAFVLSTGIAVRAAASAGASVPPPTSAIAAPQNVDASPEADAEITVTWSPVVGAVSYDVFRGPHDGELSFLGNTTATAYLDTGLPINQEFDYAVAANDGSGDGVLSEVADASSYHCSDIGSDRVDTVDITTPGIVYCGMGSNDQITVDAANVVVLGGAGNDRITDGPAGSGTMEGGTGNDKLIAGPGGDTIDGNAGNDKILGGTGPDVLNGDTGNDRILGLDANDTISGGDGNDRLAGGTGDDTITGGTGDDHINGNDGNDIEQGDEGDDHITGGEGNDIEQGDDGNDVVIGNDGNDDVDGDNGDDVVSGGAGDDVVQGDDGNDVVNGGSGDDVDMGGAGDDTVNAGSGDDVEDGGEGNDNVDCGSGSGEVVTDEDSQGQNQDGDAANCDDDIAASTVGEFEGTIGAFTAGSSIVVDTASGPVPITINAGTRISVENETAPQVGDQVEVVADTSTTPPVALFIHSEAPDS